nr:hypothetical protein [Salipiger mucosus]
MDPDTWTPDMPCTGQCAVTACLVHDEIGLPMVRALALLPDGSAASYYFNEGLDLCLGQFPEGTVVERRPGPQGDEAFAYVMTNPDVVERLAILRSNFGATAPEAPDPSLYSSSA